MTNLFSFSKYEQFVFKLEQNCIIYKQVVICGFSGLVQFLILILDWRMQQLFNNIIH